MLFLLHFLEHSLVRPVCVAKRKRLSSYRCDKLDLQAIVSDLQFLEVNTVTIPADCWICIVQLWIDDKWSKSHVLSLLSLFVVGWHGCQKSLV